MIRANIFKRTLAALIVFTLRLPAGEPPVLLELFTSEGCSSCPPADLFLQELDALSAKKGDSVIVLSEHVDYWNDLGWRDPFSSSQFSNRQRAYAERLKSEVFTPQVVINGTKQYSGSDSRAIVRAIAEAPMEGRLLVELKANAMGEIEVIAGPLPQGRKSADVMLALATDHAQSSVGAGENKGRTLKHTAIVQTLRKLGTVDARAPFREVVKAKADRIVVFVQEKGTGAVLGAALLRISSK